MVWGEKVMLPGTKAKPLITQGFGVPSDLFWCCHHGDSLHKQLQNNQMKRKEKHWPRRSGVIWETKEMSRGVTTECRNCSSNNHPPFLLWGWTKVWQITERSLGPASSGFRKCSQKNWNKWVEILRVFTHSRPGTLSWACGVQGWNKADVLWRRGWVWDSRELDLVACPWPWFLSQLSEGGKHLQATPCLWGFCICYRFLRHSRPHAILFESLTQRAPVQRAEPAMCSYAKKKTSGSMLCWLLHWTQSFHWPWITSSSNLNPCSLLFQTAKPKSLTQRQVFCGGQ